MAATKQFEGIFTALITPFKNGKLDEKAYQEFVDWQIREGVHGLIPCGTTGESPTLSYEEHQRLIQICVEAAAGRVPVMAGTGANSTAEAIMFTQHAQKVGADAALIVTPYYNKPTQEGIFQHYKAIHDATDLPIFVYNIPARSVINVTDDTFARLAELPRIKGVKDATGDLARVSTLRHRLGDRLVQFSGEDMTAVGFNAMGGKGCISVTSNLMPALCADVQNACLKGDYAKALSLHDKLVPLHAILFCETNPIPVKYAAHLMGKCSLDFRLPLVPPTDEHRRQLQAVLQKLKLM